MNDTIRALTARKSMRVFTDDTVAPEMKDAILHAAMQAPTAGNQMLYTILDITDKALKDKLAVLCDNQPFIAAAPLVLIFLADWRRWHDCFAAAHCTPRAPREGDLFLAMTDACIAAQNAVVAIESFGFGSCYIGDILENAEAVREVLHLPAHVMPAAMLVAGYPTEQQKNRKKPARYRKEYIVHENTYHTLSAAQHAEMYAVQAADEALPHPDFETDMQAFCKRKYESAFSKEMSRSAAVYLKDFQD